METYEQYEKKMTRNAKRYRKSLGISDNSTADNSTSNSSNHFGSISGKSILSFIFLALLVICIYKFYFTSQVISFESFLNWLGSVNSTPIRINISDFTIKGQWVVLDELRLFLNALGSVVGVGVFLGANLINLFIFIGQFVAFLFA